MTKPYPFTIHKHKGFDILMRLVSTENDYYFLRSLSGHLTWFGTYQEFVAQFQPSEPSPSFQEQKTTTNERQNQ